MAAAASGDMTAAQEYKRNLSTRFGKSLEDPDIRKILAKPASANTKKKKSPVVQSIPEVTDGIYTLQVGAFATKENAQKLSADLMKRFDSVSISQNDQTGKVLYKVRVGSFATESEALEFGEKKVKAMGYSFRVIKN
jgi:cell division protein FtsN